MTTFQSTIKIESGGPSETWRWEARRDGAPYTKEEGSASTRAKAWLEAIKCLRQLGPTDVPSNPSWDEVMDIRLGPPSNSTMREAIDSIRAEEYERGKFYQAQLGGNTPQIVGDIVDVYWSDQPNKRINSKVWCDHAPYVVEWAPHEINACVNKARDEGISWICANRVDSDPAINGKPVYLAVDKISAIEEA